jgi:hypothetical protein
MIPFYLTPRRFIGLVAGLLLAIGALGLVIGVSADSLYGTQPCGNGLAAFPNNSQACTSAVLTRRLWAWPVAGVGAIGLIGAVLIVVPQRRRDDELDEAEPTDV